MKLETLYKRAKTGKIQYWQIEVEDPIRRKEDGDWAYIRKESGQLGTDSPVKHTETIKSGKQGRNYIQQAEFQAQSDWKKKKDEGYKALSDLHVAAHFRVDSNSNDPQHLENLLNELLPKSNTDANGNVKPMLATDWNKVKSIPYPVIVEPKLDGVRCLLIADSNKGKDVKFLSRSGKEYTSLNHIAEQIKYHFAKTSSDVSFILDGEIYSDELNFQEIVSAVKAYKPNSEKLKFHVYDVVTEDPMHIRRLHSRDLVKSIGSEFITHIEHSSASDHQGVIELHNLYVQQGYEGAMIRFYDGTYGQGSRSRELLKVKEFNETEYEIDYYEFGQREEDLIFICKSPNGAFKAKMMGSKAQKIQIEEQYQEHYENERTVKLTVKHFGLTEDGLPRFPVGKSIRDYD